jgi:hypothetical protein
VIGAAVRVARIGMGEEVDEHESNAPRSAAAELGKPGGTARARELTPEQRAECPQSRFRWGKSKV